MNNEEQNVSSVRETKDKSPALEFIRDSFFQEVLFQINEMVIITNARPIDGAGPEIVYVNEAFERISGYSSEEVIGKTPRILAGPKTNRETLDQIRTALLNWQASRTELLNYRKNGEEYWVELEIVPLKDEKGWVTHWVGIERDITERKIKELKDQEKLQKWKLALESAGDGLWDWHVKENVVSYSKHWKEMIGYKENEIESSFEEWSKRVHPDDLKQALAEVDAHLKGGSIAYVNEHRLRCKNGNYKWILSRGLVVERGDQGEPLRFIGTHADISFRKKREQDLLLENQTLAALTFDVIAEGVVVQDRDGKVCVYNHSAELLLDLSLVKLNACGGLALWPQAIMQDLSLLKEADSPFNQAMVTEQPVRGFVLGLPNSSAQVKWLSVNSVPIKDAKGRVHRVVSSFSDISERVVAEKALNFQKLLLSSMNESVVATDLDGKINFWNPAAENLFGWKEMEVLGSDLSSYFPNCFSRKEAEEMQAHLKAGISWSTDVQLNKKEGQPFLAQLTNTPIKDQKGDFSGILSIYSNITERKVMEESLRVSERRMKALIDATPDSIFFKDHKGRLVLINKSASDLFLLEGVNYYGKTDLELSEMVPLRREEFLYCVKSDEEVWRGEKIIRVMETLQDQNQNVLQFDVIKIPLFNADGSRHGLVIVGRDVTESRTLQEQLKQAQKMEAIGQLAGGIAHDFNNTLAAILLNLEYLESTTVLDEEGSNTISNLKLMVDQSSGMTRQLLMFSRQNAKKQEPAQLNHAIDQTIKLLRRLIGSNIEIVRSALDADIWIEVDMSMFNQTIMNLCLNARDAMPNGGKLRIETSICEVDGINIVVPHTKISGSYACVNIQDCGVGMDDYTKQHLFEPFFTRKEVGKGTGLGLATVYGIMEQHQGWVEVESELGVGSVFKLYFPLTTPQKKNILQIDDPQRQTTHEKVILLVEDLESLRKITANVLRKLGYEVLEAANPEEAMHHWEVSMTKIDILFTDVVMPGGVNGTEIARAFSLQKPHLIVIITSGYNQEMVHADWATGTHFLFIPKPYELAHLESVLGKACLSSH